MKNSGNDIFKGEPCILGIDEAGRGPVLGPMVYGCCIWPTKQNEKLGKLGFDDSKVLTADRREELFLLIKQLKEEEKLDYKTDVLTAKYISNSMLKRTPESLNKISYESAFGLIDYALDKGYNLEQCYLDTVGDPSFYKKRLEGYFMHKAPEIQFIVESKADSTYPVVSAASICAKQTRDHAIENYEFNVPVASTKIGCGYPSDPVTKQWLKDNIAPIFGFSDLVRFSWKTCQTILDNALPKIDWEAHPEEEKNMDIQTMFKKVESRKSYFTRSLDMMDNVDFDF